MLKTQTQKNINFLMGILKWLKNNNTSNLGAPKNQGFYFQDSVIPMYNKIEHKNLFYYLLCLFLYPVYKLIMFSFIISVSSISISNYFILFIISLTLIYIITGLIYIIYQQKYNIFILDFINLIHKLRSVYYFFISLNFKSKLIILISLPLIFIILYLVWLVLISPVIGLKILFFSALSITVPTLFQLLILAMVTYTYICFIYKNLYFFISFLFGNKNAKSSNIFSENMLLAISPFKFLWIIIIVILCWYFKPISLIISYLSLVNPDLNLGLNSLSKIGKANSLDLNKGYSNELSSIELELNSNTKSLSNLSNSKSQTFMSKWLGLFMGKKGQANFVYSVKFCPITTSTTTFNIEDSTIKKSKIISEVVKSRLSTILVNSGFKRNINIEPILCNLSVSAKKAVVKNIFLTTDSLAEKKVTNKILTKNLDLSCVNKPVYITSDIQVMLDGIEKACLSVQKEGFFSDISDISKNQYLDLVVKNQVVESTTIMVNMMQEVEFRADRLESNYMEYDPQKRYVSDTPPSRLLKAGNGNLYYSMLADWIVNQAGLKLSTLELAEDSPGRPVYARDKITLYSIGIEVGNPICYELREFIRKSIIFNTDLDPYIPAIRSHTLSYCKPMLTPPESAFPAHADYYKDLALWLMYIIRIGDNIMLSDRNYIEGRGSNSYYTFRLIGVDSTNDQYKYHYNFLRDMVDGHNTSIEGNRLNHNTKISDELLRSIYNYKIVDNSQVYVPQVKYAEINPLDEVYEQVSNLQVNSSLIYYHVDGSINNYPIVNNPEMDLLLYDNMPIDPLYDNMPIDLLLYDNMPIDPWLYDPANRLP